MGTLLQRRQEYTKGQRQPLHKCAGKTRQLQVKNKIRTLPHTIHKGKVKMDERPKCKTRNYKTCKRKHRQNTV